MLIRPPSKITVVTAINYGLRYIQREKSEKKTILNISSIWNPNCRGMINDPIFKVLI
jgi:hypothetical protein